MREKLDVLRELGIVKKNCKEDSGTLAEEELIRKTPNGFLMKKQNFDWIEKPKSAVNENQSKPLPVKAKLMGLLKNKGKQVSLF